MKKNWKTIPAITLLVCMILMSFAGCGKSEAEAPKAETTVPVTEAAAESQEAPAAVEVGLESWSLEAAAWTDSNGASVTFTAKPLTYIDGMTARLLIRLNGADVQSLACTWDGTNFTTTAELPAADGYGYVCVLSANGQESEDVLSDPENPTNDALVFMQSSLNAYCNLFVADWEETEDSLNITSGYVQVQLPQITVSGSQISLDTAQLVFQLNGTTIETQVLELPQGEGAGSYETALTSVSFQMPGMDDDYQLDLYLNVKLSDGQELSANGGSWYYNNSTLSMIVG